MEDALCAIAARMPLPDLPSDLTGLVLGESEVERIRVNLRRAAALGELARSVFGQDALPTRELIVTIDATQIPTDIDGELSGVARVEKWGEMIACRLPELLANSKVIVRPVLDPATLGAMDGHDPSALMRLALDVRDPYSMEPYGATPARSCDADHTVAFQPGRRGQTRLGNLGNFSRFAHRAKTAGVVRVDQISPGVFRWRYRSGQEFLVSRRGTTRLRGPGRPASQVTVDLAFHRVRLAA